MLRPRLLTAFILAALAHSSSATTTEIARGVFLVSGEFVEGHQPDGNSIIFVAPRGLIVVDTGRHHGHTQSLLDFAAARKTPITDVINSHWHLDHTGGNLMIREAFPKVRIHASGAIKEALTGFLADYAVQLKNAIAGAPANSDEVIGWQAELKLIDSGETLAPDLVITRSGEERMAGRKLVLHLETNAVTAGDVWIFDPTTKVLVAGDLITLPFPFLDTACPTRWKEALDHLGRADFRLLVPGHGSPMTRAMFNSYRRAFDRLQDCSASSEKVAVCSDRWISDAGPLLDGWDPEFTRKLAGYYIENVLRAPPEKTARLCGQ